LALKAVLPGCWQRLRHKTTRRIVLYMNPENAQLLLDGVKLMVMGMVTVFVFLVLMVCFMTILSKLLAPLGKAGFMESAPAPVKKPAAKKAAGGNDAALAAAAVAAVKAHTK